MTLLGETYTDIYVSPSPWLILFTLLFAGMLVCAGVAAAKGRWGWFVAGLLLGGLPWLAAPFLTAMPDSAWGRRRARRE